MPTIEQIEQHRRRQLDLAQHIADLRGEEILGDDPEEQEIEWDQDDQRRQIKHGISVQFSLRRACGARHS
jgi:hypothetical protein